MKILAICGSLQKRSSNLTLLQTAQATAPPDVSVEIYAELGELPHFNPDLAAEGVPEVVTRLRGGVRGSDARWIACPEYGLSLPGSLKNAIDWLIDSGELERKIVAVTAATAAPERGRRGLAALCDTLHAVSACVVGGEPIARGPGFEAGVRALCAALVAKVEEGVPDFEIE
jgi:chromate reductase